MILCFYLYSSKVNKLTLTELNTTEQSQILVLCVMNIKLRFATLGPTILITYKWSWLNSIFLLSCFFLTSTTSASVAMKTQWYFMAIGDFQLVLQNPSYGLLFLSWKFAEGNEKEKYNRWKSTCYYYHIIILCKLVVWWWWWKPHCVVQCDMWYWKLSSFSFLPRTMESSIWKKKLSSLQSALLY